MSKSLSFQVAKSHRMLPKFEIFPNFDVSLTGLLVVSFFPLSTAKHFHNLMVSSAAALATVVPSGDIVKHNTRAVWPEIFIVKSLLLFKLNSHSFFSVISTGLFYFMIPLGVFLAQPFKIEHYIGGGVNGGRWGSSKALAEHKQYFEFQPILTCL